MVAKYLTKYYEVNVYLIFDSLFNLDNFNLDNFD